MGVLRGSLEPQNIMHAYGNRPPGVTLVKFNDRERQTSRT